MPAMDIELIGELFDNCRRGAGILGTDAEFRSELERVQKRLPPLQIGKRGNIRSGSRIMPKPNLRTGMFLICTRFIRVATSVSVRLLNLPRGGKEDPRVAWRRWNRVVGGMADRALGAPS